MVVYSNFSFCGCGDWKTVHSVHNLIIRKFLLHYETTIVMSFCFPIGDITGLCTWHEMSINCWLLYTYIFFLQQVSTNIGCTEPQAYALKKRLIPQKKSLKEITRAAEDLETGDGKMTFTCYSDGEVKHGETLISRSTSSSYSSTPGLKLRNPNIPSSKHTFEKGNNGNSSRVLLKRQAIFTPEKTTSAKCLRLSAARNSTPTGQHSNSTHMTISKKQPALGLDEVTSTFSDEAFGIEDKMDSLTSTSAFRSFKNPQESATTATSLRTPQNKARLAFTAQNNTASRACTTPQNTACVTFNTPQNTASVAFNTPQNTASVAFNTPQNTASVASNTPQSTARVAFSALHNTLNVAFNTPTNTTSATFNTPTNTTSATFNTPTNTTSATFHTPTNTTSSTFNTPTNTTSATFHTPTNTTSSTFNTPTNTTSSTFNTPTNTTSATFHTPTNTTSSTFNTPTNTTSATFNTPTNTTSATFNTPQNAASVAIDTSQNTTSMVFKTPQNTASMPSKTPLNTASMFFKTPQNTAGVAFNTPQNNASVALKTSKNTTCRAFNTLQNSASVAFNTPQNTTSVPLKTPQNTTSVPLKTPQNTTSAPFKTPQNTTSVHFKTPQNTASLAFKTPLNPSARSVSCRTPQSMPAATSTMKVTPPLCKCGRRAKRRMVQNPGPNTGRWFFSCVRGVANSANSKASGCGYFQWEHSSAVVPAGRVTPGGQRSFYQQTMGLGNSVTYPVTPVLQVHGSLKTQLRWMEYVLFLQ